MPSMPDGYYRGPEWMYWGAYATSAYSVARGLEARDVIDLAMRGAARRVTQPLEALDTRERFDQAGHWDARAVGFLAMQWLVERAGEAALLDYYRLLPASDSWEQAFEGAFGIATDDFYTAFEAYRAEVAPPLPHLAGG